MPGPRIPYPGAGGAELVALAQALGGQARGVILAEDPSGTSNMIGGGVLTAPVLQAAGDIQTTSHVPAATPRAVAQLPAEPAVFAGRDEDLAVLAGLLDPALTSGSVVVVSAVAVLAG